MRERLAYVLRWEIWSALMFLAHVMFIAGSRPLSADVIYANDRAGRLAVQVRIQRNMHEQLTLMVQGHLALATMRPLDQLRITLAPLHCLSFSAWAIGLDIQSRHISDRSGPSALSIPTLPRSLQRSISVLSVKSLHRL
jgi:hypothetical protein